MRFLRKIFTKKIFIKKTFPNIFSIIKINQEKNSKVVNKN